MKKEIILDTLDNLVLVYEENDLTGKRSITIDGCNCVSSNNRDFKCIVNDQEVLVKVNGNFLSGIRLEVNQITYVVKQPYLWYEYVFAVLAFMITIIWGNVPELCKIIPVVGGAIGGVISASVILVGLELMNKVKNPLYKVLIGLGLIVATFGACAAVGLLIVGGTF